MSDFLAANRYAEALFQTVQPLKDDAAAEAELLEFSSALRESPVIGKLFENPSLTLEEKIGVLEKLYRKNGTGLNVILLNFFKTLVRKNRFGLIHDIAFAFKKIADEAQNEALAEIKTAVPLDARAEQAIVSGLVRIAGFKIEVKKEIDPSLIGGVVVRFRNKVLDGSVKNRLRVIQKTLTKAETI